MTKAGDAGNWRLKRYRQVGRSRNAHIKEPHSFKSIDISQYRAVRCGVYAVSGDAFVIPSLVVIEIRRDREIAGFGRCIQREAVRNSRPIVTDKTTRIRH